MAKDTGGGATGRVTRGGRQRGVDAAAAVRAVNRAARLSQAGRGTRANLERALFGVARTTRGGRTRVTARGRRR